MDDVLGRFRPGAVSSSCDSLSHNQLQLAYTDSNGSLQLDTQRGLHVTIILGILIVLFGIFPGLALDVIIPAVSGIFAP